MCNDSYSTMCDDCLDEDRDECEDGYECPECEQLELDALEEPERFNPDSVPAYVPLDRVNGGPAWIDSLDPDEAWFYDDDGCEREY